MIAAARRDPRRPLEFRVASLELHLDRPAEEERYKASTKAAGNQGGNLRQKPQA
eukprot:CAMPEP_0197931654 /NCGR_PEP_ID=MMETSP1439-20131203/107401_1 /TAXON_ID=66791 /ORGANISM="Gonyaulax spinifera, Strain CCMP409" /LENGTH=53 /DNA_ID=CAMNT_0043554399 /DNA_START=59 /DNA_END=220 /DNA_ORIENTATION=-